MVSTQYQDIPQGSTSALEPSAPSYYVNTRCHAAYSHQAWQMPACLASQIVNRTCRNLATCQVTKAKSHEQLSEPNGAISTHSLTPNSHHSQSQKHSCQKRLDSGLRIQYHSWNPAPPTPPHQAQPISSMTCVERGRVAEVAVHDRLSTAQQHHPQHQQGKREGKTPLPSRKGPGGTPPHE